MLIEIEPQDASFLRDHLNARLRAVEDELVHTDKREIQRTLAADANRLRALISRFST